MSRRSNKPSSYSWGSEVICLSRGAYYDARIIKIEQRDDDQTLYRVHYKGWSQTYGKAACEKARWDEYVEEDKLMPNTPENQQKAREFNERVKQELAQAQAKRRAASGASSTPAREKAASEEPGSGADKKQGLSSSAPFPAGAAAKRAKSSKPELNLVLPEAIEVQLVDDWEAITRDQRLVEVPKKPSVAEILDEFEKAELEGSDDGHELMQGLKLYFDHALSKMLLYRFERQQYADLRKEYGDDARMSDLYGCEHLLRLIVKLPYILESAHMSKETLQLVNDVLNRLIKYLAANLDRLVMAEYDNAPPEYISFSKNG